MNKDKLVLLFAQGFGTGLAPFAPGTFGAFLGIGWFALLLSSGNFWIFQGGQLASFFFIYMALRKSRGDTKKK